MTKCDLKDVTKARGGGETAVPEDIRQSWMSLRERMKKEDENAEREFLACYPPLITNQDFGSNV